ncbi:MAG: hypothetical protein ACLQVN_20490 [Bryobacteraceae bacterium]
MHLESQQSQSKPRDPRALNAYRHGLTGQVHVLTPADQAVYERHCRGIHQSFAPVGAFETDLVQSIADDRWRLKRAAAIEDSIYALDLGASAPDAANHAEVDVALTQARTWLSEGKSLELLTLYESRIQRRVERNVAILRQLQADRKAALEQAIEEAELLAEFAEKAGETYDPASDFPRELLHPQFDFSSPQIARLIVHYRRLKESRMRRPDPEKWLQDAA